MRTAESKPKEGKPISKKKVATHKSPELKTDPPISEKDEVKRAEQKLRKNTGR